MSTLDLLTDSGFTIREYLKELLLELWEEKESFSGKRPFGNSGWEYDLYKPLIKHGIVNGLLDEDDYIEEIDRNHADRVIKKCIIQCFLKQE